MNKLKRFVFVIKIQEFYGVGIMFRKYGDINKNKLKKFTEETKLKLPADYNRFLRSYNGGDFGDEYIGFCLRGEKNSIYMDKMLGIGGDPITDLSSSYSTFRTEIPKNTIIIGETIETGKILLSCETQNGGIYLWDKDIVLDQSTEENNIYKIADSFDEFWNRLHSIA